MSDIDRKYREPVSYDESEYSSRKVPVDASNRRQASPGGRNRKSKRKLRILSLVVDVAIAALIMLVFYITNYALHTETSGQRLSALPSGSADQKSETAVVSKEGSAAAGDTSTPQAASQPDQSGASISWRDQFADKFTSGPVEKTDTSYKSANINISINRVQKENLTYFFAEIYVADIQYFKTAFAKQADVMGERERTLAVATENNAILAINGDLCIDNSGPVVRNGQLYRDEVYADALVMNNDGSMQTFSADQLDMNAIKTNGAWQVWTFGPMLLKDGQPMTEFNSTLKKANPRTAVGYYEPGHYCFLVVDGRQSGYSKGMTLQELSQFFYDQGCTVAFNLDGGQSSEMVFLGNVVNQPYDGGRSASDILYIADS